MARRTRLVYPGVALHVVVLGEQRREGSGLLTELRAREYYEKPTAERKRKLAAAVKRHYKRLRSQMLPDKLY